MTGNPSEKNRIHLLIIYCKYGFDRKFFINYVHLKIFDKNTTKIWFIVDNCNDFSSDSWKPCYRFSSSISIMNKFLSFDIGKFRIQYFQATIDVEWCFFEPDSFFIVFPFGILPKNFFHHQQNSWNSEKMKIKSLNPNVVFTFLLQDWNLFSIMMEFV